MIGFTPPQVYNRGELHWHACSRQVWSGQFCPMRSCQIVESFDHPLARLPFGLSLATHLAPTPLHTLASHEPWNSAKSDVTSSAFYPGPPLELALPE